MSEATDSELKDALLGLSSEQRSNTLSWVLLAVSDGLPRDGTYPQALGTFIFDFLQNKVRVDPTYPAPVVRTQLAKWAKTHLPDKRTVEAILGILRKSVNAEKTIGECIAMTQQDGFD